MSLLFLINAWPIFTGRVGWMFAEKEEPIEYSILNDYIKNQDESFRVLWIPRMSGWGYYNWDKSSASLATVEQKEYKNFFSGFSEKNNYADYFFKLFEKPYGNQLINISNMKYVVIPMPEKQDDVFEYYGKNYEKYVEKIENINFLEEVKLEGLNEIKLYENKNYKARIFSFEDLFNLSSLSNLEDKYTFIVNDLDRDFYFTTGNEKVSTSALIDVRNIFEKIDRSTIKDSTLTTAVEKKASEYSLYSIAENDEGLFVSYEKNKIILFKKPVSELLFNSNQVTRSTNEREIIKIMDVRWDAKNYYIQLDDKLLSLKKNTELNLGENDRERTITILGAEDNIIPNPSFEEGLWRKTVNNCHNYDENPIISMELNKKDSSDGNQSLQLEAARHIACTSINIPINSTGKHVFSFDYQSPNAKEAGYYIIFDDAEKTVHKKKMLFVGDDWQRHTETIDVPEGTTNAVLFIYAYPSDEEINFINRYDDFGLSKLNKLTEIRLESDRKFVKKSLILTAENNTFTYSNVNYNFANIIPNPSFEEGLWQETVGDCHNYDENPILSMKLNKKDGSDGNQSLQLEAARHIACVVTDVLVDSGSDYLLSFDHRGLNTNRSSYYIGFNDENKTFIKEDVKISSAKDWQSFFQTISIPQGATTARIYLYAKPPENGKKSVNYYDNVSLIKMPKNLKNDYYLVGIPEKNLVPPQKTIIDSDGSTKKIVSIKGATTPFFLALSESYNSKWQLYIDNSEAGGFLSAWLPFGSANKIDDNYHYKLNDFLNTWYIDVDKICSQKENCIKNSDGSYDIKITLEFWLQRWFYTGVIISSLALFSCLFALAYLQIKTDHNEGTIQ